MTTRMSEVTPEPEDDDFGDFQMDYQDLLFAARSAEPRPASPFGRDAPVHELTEADADLLRGHKKWPECEFEGCSDPAALMRRDRFGAVHRACMGHEEELDRWVSIHNGWEEIEPSGDGEPDAGGGEGNMEDASG